MAKQKQLSEQIELEAIRVFGKNCYVQTLRSHPGTIVAGSDYREIKVVEPDRQLARQTLLRCLKAQP